MSRPMRVQIREIATGRTVVRADMTWERETTDGLVYMWTDGNYGCDCNREMFFRQALGLPVRDKDLVCGNGERYAVDWLELDGERLLP